MDLTGGCNNDPNIKLPALHKTGSLRNIEGPVLHAMTGYRSGVSVRAAHNFSRKLNPRITGREISALALEDAYAEPASAV